MPEKDRWLGALITSAFLLVLLSFGLFALLRRSITYLASRLRRRLRPDARERLPECCVRLAEQTRGRRNRARLSFPF
jgi:hypothetical protein